MEAKEVPPPISRIEDSSHHKCDEALSKALLKVRY